MTDVNIGSKNVSSLRCLAEILIPARDVMPGAGSVRGINLWLERAVRASGYSSESLGPALDALPANIDWEMAKAFSLSKPDAFAILSTIVSAAYYMAPEVLDKLGYPSDRRDPAGVEDFATEFETGVFDRILSRPPQFRDTER